MRIISAIITITFATLMSSAQSSLSAPDFAFPEKVTSQAITDYNKAIASGDGQMVIDAMIRYSLAQTDIDPARVNSVTARIDSAITASADPLTKSLLHLLQARTYYDAYVRDSWAYNERQLPLEPLPADITEWSGDQFRMLIKRNISEALKPYDELASTPIDRFSKVIVADRTTQQYYPALLDFVASQSLSLLSGMSNDTYQIGTRWLDPTRQFIKLDPTLLPGNLPTVMSIYQAALKAHAADSPAGVMWDCQRLNYVSTHLPSDDDDDGVKQYNNALSALLRQLGDSEYAAFPLTYMRYPSRGDVAALKEYLTALEAYVQRHPDFLLTNTIQNLINQMKQKSVEVNYRAVTTLGHPLPVTVRSTNATEAELLVYQVNQPQATRFDRKVKSQSKLIDRIPLTFPDRPLERVDTAIEVTLPAYGNYAIVEAVDGEESTNTRLVAVTDVMLGSVSAPGTDVAFVVNPLTGEPVEKVQVMNLENLSKDQRRPVGTTDDFGLLNLPKRRDELNLYPRRGDDIYSPAVGSYYAERDNDTRYSACVYTALPIYHPGDSIDIAAIVSATDLKGTRPVEGRRLTVQLLNPYYDAVTSTVATTDDWGCIQARLLAPTNNSQGSYIVRILTEGTKQTIIGSGRVMVSDYKMPQVMVTLNEPRMVAGQPVVISGKVTNYTGFPLEGSKIALRLSNAPRWRWWYNGDNTSPFYTAETTADASGAFTITIPAAVLVNAPLPDGMMRAEVIATAPSGESQSDAVSLAAGKAYQINADIPAVINAGRPLAISATVNDANGPANIPLKLTLKSETAKDRTYLLKPGVEIDLSDIASGEYEYSIAPTDAAISAKAVEGSLIIYRDDDTASPVSQLLWSPISNYLDANDRGQAVMQIECATDSTYALLTFTTAERTLRREWVMLHQGMNRINLQLPDGVDLARATLIATRDLRYGAKSLSVRSVRAQNSLKLHITSMRDRVTPGAEEQITLTLTNADGSPAQGALIVDMWNKSLQTLAPLRMTAPYFDSDIPIGYTLVEGSVSSSVRSKVRWLNTKSVEEPEFNFYQSVRPIYSRMHKSASRMDNVVLREVAVADSPVASAPQLNASMATSGESDFSDEVTVDDSGSGTGGARYVSPTANTEVGPAYRDAATPLSFFRPMLTTDADGRVTLTYTVPNANALWSLNAIAYNNEMLSTSAVAEIISSKPVMLQFNVPRFLRMGDQARLRATVMNSTDRTQTVVTHVEFYDTASGEIIAREDAQRTVAANGSATMSFTVKAPFSSAMIGYRIVATAGNYSDAERGMIPLLESVAPVVESDNFYMHPDQVTITRELPSSDIDGTVTLQLCENPAWYVVAALPGLRASQTNTANAAAAAIFSAATADGLLRTNPRIKSMIHRWVASDKSDSTLVSMLQRNADLKTALLQATPWMVDAASDTERMGRLALLFDPKEVRSAIDCGVADLAKMQCNGGGWSWTPDYKQPSMWVTLNVLGQLGRLKQLGFLPTDASLDKMIRNALTYVDCETAAQYRKNPKGGYMLYVATRDYFPNIPQSTASARVTESTLQYIIANWGDMDVTTKALAATILNAHDYNATARQVMRSVREYAVTNPDYGLWWPSLTSRYNGRYYKMASAAIILDALTAVTPGSDDIDLLRQWIVVQKQTQDWSDAAVTTDLITSFLNSGTNWTVPPVGVSVEVNSDELTDRSPMAGTGEIRANLTDMLAKTPGQLTITKPGNYPAWGAVITRQRMELSAVKAAPCQGLSIEKTLYKVVGDGSGQRLEPATTLAVGDKVRVDLLIRADNDMDYVVMIDRRGACFEPVEQTPEPTFSQGICFYRENRDTTTNLYIDRLPAGTYRLSYDLYVNSAGTYSGGIATIQSQYAPALTAHSAGALLTVAPN